MYRYVFAVCVAIMALGFEAVAQSSDCMANSYSYPPENFDVMPITTSFTTCAPDFDFCPPPCSTSWMLDVRFPFCSPIDAMWRIEVISEEYYEARYFHHACNPGGCQETSMLFSGIAPGECVTVLIYPMANDKNPCADQDGIFIWNRICE